MILDELEQIKEIDKSNMLSVIRTFPEQIEEIIIKARAIDLSNLEQFNPTKIMVCGMGGSAISGDIVKSWLLEKSDKIIHTIRNYKLPEFVDETTLVFACSYSGNTEETLNAVQEAFERKCKIICITSGGTLQEFCLKNGIPYLKIPSGFVPRAAIAYLFFPIIIILERLQVISQVSELPRLINTLKEYREKLLPEVPVDDNQAKIFAQKISEGIPYIYSHTYLNVIAQRWKTQLNENGKILAMVGEIPEMNHNEIVGWYGDNQEIANKFIVVLLRSVDEHERIKKRFELSKKMLNAVASNIIEIEAYGDSRLTRMFTLLYLGDFISIYLALLRGIDPTPVIPIDRLKKLMKE